MVSLSNLIYAVAQTQCLRKPLWTVLGNLWSSHLLKCLWGIAWEVSMSKPPVPGSWWEVLWEAAVPGGWTSPPPAPFQQLRCVAAACARLLLLIVGQNSPGLLLGNWSALWQARKQQRNQQLVLLVRMILGASARSLVVLRSVLWPYRTPHHPQPFENLNPSNSLPNTFTTNRRETGTPKRWFSAP